MRLFEIYDAPWSSTNYKMDGNFTKDSGNDIVCQQCKGTGKERSITTHQFSNSGVRVGKEHNPAHICTTCNGTGKITKIDKYDPAEYTTAEQFADSHQDLFKFITDKAKTGNKIMQQFEMELHRTGTLSGKSFTTASNLMDTSKKLGSEDEFAKRWKEREAADSDKRRRASTHNRTIRKR